MSTLYAFSCAMLILHFSTYASGSGVSEVKTILGGFIIKDFLSFKTLVIKCIGLVLVCGSGLAVGKEGPMIHVAVCIANTTSFIFSRFAKNEARKREIFSAASAAGVAVAFGCLFKLT